MPTPRTDKRRPAGGRSTSTSGTNSRRGSETAKAGVGRDPDLREAEELRLHARATVVPEMTDEEFRPFVVDIAERGILTPLEITEAGVVLDGRARLCAARELGLARVPVQVLAPDDELEHMLRAALRRRHLSPSQRAALAVELDEYGRAGTRARRRSNANLVQATEGATLPPRGKTREFGASIAGASARTVQDAATVRRHDAELFERVKQGLVSAPLAARQVRRRLRDAQLPIPAPPPDGPFELVYADPPWQLGHPDSPHAPENHYPTMEVEAIKALEVPAADDAVLFLWAVSSLLPEALDVVAAWGFECKSTLCWVKPSIGPGIWLRNRHELLLVCRRGQHPPPDPEDRIDSVLEARRGRHSEKPRKVYELLERMYPQASKLELFARRHRPGWCAWGNEVPS